MKTSRKLQKEENRFPFIPLEMSFIQPEWMYLHYLGQEENEPSSQPMAVQVPTSVIRVHIRPRKSSFIKDVVP
jgi:hypothetical protein